MAESNRDDLTTGNSTAPEMRYGEPWQGRLDGERSMATSYGLIGAILLFGGIGYLLDRQLHTAPWLLLMGLILAIIVGFVGLGRLVGEGRRRA